MPTSGTVPADVSRLVGRVREIREVRATLGRARLVTLLGPGGVGKTRVALQVARDSARAFADGVWFVELAALRDPALVEPTVAAALGQAEHRAAGGRLAERIRSWDALLVVDNCEHLVPACAELVRDLLRTAPGVRVLTTSREELGVTGEHVLALRPLAVPAEPDGRDMLPELLACESVQLLVERARAIRPEFDLSPANAADVARLCCGLEGVPLAIELAAARLRTMSPGQIADRLDDPYRILTGGPRDLPERQSSVENAVAWSYELCSHAEQELWARMSVFAGAVDAEIVEQVCGGPDPLDVLDALVRKSVVVCEHTDVPRFRMLGSLRHHGRRRLAEGAAAELARGHARYHRDLVHATAAAWFSGQQVPLAAVVRRALPDLRLALDHLLGADDPAAALAMASDLHTVWLCLGNLREGDLWLRRALAVATAGSPALPTALYRHGWIQLVLGAEEEAITTLDGAIATAQAQGDGSARDHAIALRAAADAFRGNLDTAVDACGRAVAGRRAAGDLAGLALTLMLLGEMMWARGDADAASECGVESELLCRTAGEVWCQSYALWVQALALGLRGDHAGAADAARRSLGLKRELGDPVGVMLVSEVLSWALAAGGQWSDAGLLHAAVHPRWEARCSILMGFGTLIAHGHLWDERIRTELGAKQHRKVTADAARMGLDAAVAAQLDESAPPRRRIPMAREPLTPRETEVAGLLAEGLSNRDIATRLVIAPRTAEVHVERVLVKLGFSRRGQVARWWHGDT